MRVLIAVHPFLTTLQDTGDIEFIANPWGRSPSSDQLEEELLNDQYDGVLIGTVDLRPGIAELSNSLKVISRVGVGLNNIDVEYFKEHGIITTYTPFGPTDSTAEMALALILAGTRRLTNYNSMVKHKQWSRKFNLRLKDAVVGIVGYGRIGKRLAHLLKAFGCDILLHDIQPDLATANAMDLSFVGKEELLERSDVISFHVPLKADTRDWLSYHEFKFFNRPVTIVNTARGGIVNEDAVYQYLLANPESYYCCDVFEEEPYGGKLAELENSLLTPHASSFTVGSRRQTERLAIENCIAVLRGESCAFIVENNE